MKHIIFLALVLLFWTILLPIMILKWDDNGFESIIEGLGEICGIEEFEEERL